MGLGVCAMKRLSAIVMMAAGLLGMGCSTMSNTEKGVGVGGLLGAGVGTAVGAATGNPKTGAVVGGLLGAGVGGAIGSDADERDRERRHERDMAQMSQQQAAADARKLGMIDIVQMHQAGTDSRVIVNQIQATGSTFQQSTADINYLTEQRVPPEVIVAMQQSATAAPAIGRAPRTVVVREQPTVIYERPYYWGPPPPAVGVHFIKRW